MEIITSKDNKFIKLYRKLSESKKERMQTGLFIIEGLRIVKDALAENIDISCMLITQPYFEKYSDIISQADLKGVKPIIISNELGSRISCTEKNQGIFAVCGMRKMRELSSCIKKDGKYAVLYQLQDPGNIGTIIRTADAMGLDGVILSESCDLYSPKTIRSTMGSIFRTDIWHDADIEYVINCFKESGVKTYPAVIDSNALNLKKCRFDGGSAVLIGNEGNGLPDNIVDMCDVPITIKMNGNINSMNAGMAAGIIFWEMTSAGK